MTNNNAPLRLEIASDSVPALPGIAAAFLVKFDHRKGYVVAWHRAIEGVQVEGAVEFKSLPSGLHNVRQDLVYFVQDQYAGISAYINRPDETTERNANMLAVGVLIPLEQGRVGKGWLHADGLEALARHCIENPSDNVPLEDYWNEHKLNELTPAPLTPGSPDVSVDSLPLKKQRDGANAQANGYKNFRSMSAASAFTPGAHSLTPHHPATRLIDMLDVFGPLIFPLYRAALLRKRILLVSEAPVELACNIVYNLSILSSFPRSLLQYTSRTKYSSRGIKALFNVGVSDIPTLSSKDGWVACTTDDVLASKPELFDVVVFLPGESARRATKKQYPKILLSSPELLKKFPKAGAKGTQRDAVRYQALARGLKKYPASVITHPEPVQIPMAPEGPGNDAASILSSSTIESRRDVVEPASWSQVAYTSLLWWASAGARRDGLTEEEEDEQERDEMLLGPEDDEDVTKEVAMVGYFRRLTGMMVSVVSQLVEASEEEEEDTNNEGESQSEGGDGSIVVEDEETGEEHQHLLGDRSSPDGDDEMDVSPDDMVAMALDVWSASDRKFVEAFVQLYWQRKAKVRGGRVECCGVRIL